MGLLQNANRIPTAYRNISGNTAGCATMAPVLTDLKRNHEPARVVAVANKGLNCSDSIAAATASGDGFVFS
jgi:hypothetical protein